MDNCVFCKIISGEFSSKKLYEDDLVLAFYDIQPKAPVHFLVVPKAHSHTGAADITPQNSAVIAHIFEVIASVTAELGIEQYRVITNNGEDAGQSVFHLHFHVIAGKTFGEMG